MQPLYPKEDNFQKPCACGCGELIWNRNRNGLLTFKSHHSRAGLWWYEAKPHTTKGKKRPDASLRMTLHNPNKKEEVGYSGIHGRIKKLQPMPEFCENCQLTRAYEIHNISGEYSLELSDWIWICRRCHMILDGRMTQLKQYTKV